MSEGLRMKPFQFCIERVAPNAKPYGFVFFLRNLFSFCTKVKKVSWKGFDPCIQGKNLFRFRRFQYWFLLVFQLIWKLFVFYETFFEGSVKHLFF